MMVGDLGDFGEARKAGAKTPKRASAVMMAGDLGDFGEARKAGAKTPRRASAFERRKLGVSADG